MGTYYKMYEEDMTGEFGISESSNRLDLVCWKPVGDNDSDLVFQTIEMSPEDMMKILLEGITICSYWMSKEAFEKTMKENFKEFSV